MINRKETVNKSGIYCIENTINNKKYVGRSTNIYKRIITHVCSLNKSRSKHENEYMINSWKKYGKENFKAYVLEFVNETDPEKLDAILNEKEMYYMNLYNTLDKKYGYNLRSDRDMYICHPETRIRQSIAGKKRYANMSAEEKKRLGDKTSQFWKNNPERRNEMALKVKLATTRYCFISTNMKTGDVKKYESHKHILAENPQFKWQVIYSAANGWKKSAYGFYWKKELINDFKDIVQPYLKN